MEFVMRMKQVFKKKQVFEFLPVFAMRGSSLVAG